MKVKSKSFIFNINSGCGGKIWDFKIFSKRLFLILVKLFKDQGHELFLISKLLLLEVDITFSKHDQCKLLRSITFLNDCDLFWDQGHFYGLGDTFEDHTIYQSTSHFLSSPSLLIMTFDFFGALPFLSISHCFTFVTFGQSHFFSKKPKIKISPRSTFYSFAPPFSQNQDSRLKMKIKANFLRRRL